MTTSACKRTLRLNTYNAKLAVSTHHNPNNLKTHLSPSANRRNNDWSVAGRQGVVKSENKTPLSEASCSSVTGIYVAVIRRHVRGEYLERPRHILLKRNSSCTRRGLHVWRSGGYPVPDTFEGRSRSLDRRNLGLRRSSLEVESPVEGEVHS